MKKARRRSNSGVTLIEAMIAVSILAIFSIFLANFVSASNKAMAVQYAAVPARTEAKQTMEAMIKELREGDPSAPGGFTIAGTAPSQTITFKIPNQVSATNGIQSWKQIQFAHDATNKQITRNQDGTSTVLGRNAESLTFSSSNNVVTATLQTQATISGGSDTVTTNLTSQARLRN